MEQVGLNYHRVMEAIREAGITRLHFLRREGPAMDARFPGTSVASAGLSSVEGHALMATTC